MKHKIRIVGEGAFGTFLKKILNESGRFDAYLESEHNSIDTISSIILAVPVSAYADVAERYANHHLINVCSVQEPTTITCWKYSRLVTSIHPLFGARTPADRRNSILTYGCDQRIEIDFLNAFGTLGNVFSHHPDGSLFTPPSHDKLMAKTHLASLAVAEFAKQYTDLSKDIPDQYIPNSFRLLREFVKTLEDMPPGTRESIRANSYSPFA